ncbi:MAG: DEAD/DEAH box helicase [Prevotella sp.]|nr:DEAD/DEAH box helicase [Prevotella sp.]MBS5527931.1 DEAD/DEAH box helicase [Prevotella sp.]
MDFYDLDLNDNTLDALDDMNFTTCTPIQEKCIPAILDRKDVLGVAQTGTGKTAAYLLPILSILDDGGFPQDAINCVIMSPTRELAQQIDQAMQGFSYYMPSINSVAVYGGNDGNRYNQELKGMQLGADVIIATPGRLLSHITMGNVDFSKVSFFVLDEADRMLDMGFSEDIMAIAKLLPETCQTIMFSATMPDKIEHLAKSILKNPAIIKIAVNKPAEKIKQTAYVCHDNQKPRILRDIFGKEKLSRVIIFSSSKIKVKEINRTLKQSGINSDEMHSDLEQSQRDDVMYRFKSGQVDVLVATDIVSRGIDIDDISMVINYDVPHDVEDYVHRIGRTARADRDGRAITLIRGKEIGAFMNIEKFIGRTVEKIPLPQGIGEAPEYKVYTRNEGRKRKPYNKQKKQGYKKRSGKRSERKKTST